MAYRGARREKAAERAKLVSFDRLTVQARLASRSASGQAPLISMIEALLTLSDVMGTGHHAAAAAKVAPGNSVAVVGDGATSRDHQAAP